MCIVVLCTTLISRIYTGDKAKIETASSNKEAKRVEERVAEEVTITTWKETRINVFFYVLFKVCILYLYGCGLGTLHVAAKCTLDTNNSVFWTLTFSVPWILFIKVYWRHQFWCPYWDKPRTPDLVSGGHYFFTV